MYLYFYIFPFYLVWLVFLFSLDLPVFSRSLAKYSQIEKLFSHMFCLLN